MIKLAAKFQNRKNMLWSKGIKNIREIQTDFLTETRVNTLNLEKRSSEGSFI